MNASHALERSTFAAWTGLSSHALMHTNRLIVPIIVVGIANKLPMMLGVCYTAVSLARMRSARNVWTGNVRRSLVTLSPNMKTSDTILQRPTTSGAKIAAQDMMAA